MRMFLSGSNEATRIFILTTMTVLLELNTTTLLFLPPDESGPAQVAQVTLELEGKPDVGALVTFNIAQRELSRLINLLVKAHRTNPFPTPAVFQGDGYKLHASTTQWSFGKQLLFEWGEERIEPLEEKWLFIFCAQEC